MTASARISTSPQVPSMLETAGPWVQRLPGLALLVVMAINMANATGRYVLGAARLGTDEAMVHIMIWVVMAGAVQACATRSHLAIDLMPASLSGRRRTMLYLLHDAAVMLGSGYAAYASWVFIGRIARFGTTSMGLGVPMTVPHAALLAGFGGMALVASVMVLALVGRVPVFVLRGIYGGVFSPTEAGGFACIYASIIARFVYRSMTWGDILDAAGHSAMLAARIGDAIKTEIYPASQSGAIPRMAEGVLVGTIEAFTTPTSFMTNVDARFQAFDVPGLFRAPADVQRAIHDPEYRDHMETMFRDKSLRVIGAIYNSQTVVFTLTPVTETAQMKGLKIRTFASPMQTRPMEFLGAAPLPLALSEVVPALQSGGLDGMLILTAFKYFDIGKYVTDLRFAEFVSVTVVNEDWFQMQTPDARAAILAAGRAAEQAVFDWGVQNVERTYAVWRGNGGEILTLADADQAAMEAQFAGLAQTLVSADPAVSAEYQRLKALVGAGQ